jgi:hypothetical protein
MLIKAALGIVALTAVMLITLVIGLLIFVFVGI